MSISIKLYDETEAREAPTVERVYPDRSCGQYEGGWIVDWADGAPTDIHGALEFLFVSDEGSVYAYGDDKVIGEAPVIKASADRLEALMASDPGDEYA